jgi:hypothetical protein
MSNISTPIIDVDAHFEPAADWLDEFPAIKAKLPPLLPTSGRLSSTSE